jgi:DNA-3-methyladenine glycosylase II
VLTQNGAVQAQVEAEHEERALQQALRVVSLDHDGTGYAKIDDPYVRELLQASGYLRPVLFHSPYEAAAWSVISTRTQHAQAAKLRDALSTGGIFPAPTELLELKELPGLPDAKVARLHGIAEAALNGALEREALLAMDPETAREHLQQLPGIGPFYASLILLRAVGTTDVIAYEPRLIKLVAERYGKPLEQVAERWRPFRTWVSVLIRASA